MANQHLLTKMKLGSIQNKQAAQVVKKALAEDPTVFQYDEVYDDIERDRTEKKEQSKADRKPKYIHNLLKTAERRQREFDMRVEKQIQKDLEKEGDQFKDKEAFVTSAYKKKMEELKRIEEEEKRQDALDDLTDVTKQNDLSGFYRHLYRETLDKPQCEVKKTAADSSSDISRSPEKRSQRSFDDGDDHDEPSNSRRPERDEPSHSESYAKRKHYSSHRDPDYHRERSDSDRYSDPKDSPQKRPGKERDSDSKDYHRDRSDKDRTSHRHHHHHRDRSRSRSRDRDRKRDRDSDRHRDFERRDRREKDDHDRSKYRDRDRDYDRRRDRPSDHRYHPYGRRDAPKARTGPTRSRSRSPPRKHTPGQSSSTPTKLDDNISRERSRVAGSAAASATSGISVTQTSPPPPQDLSAHPVWRKRTAGDQFTDAIERYLERRRAGRISAVIYRDN